MTRDRRIVIVIALADDRPAVILPSLDDVELIAALRSQLVLPELLRVRIDGEAARVPVPARPHVAPCPGVVDDRVVVRAGSVGIDAYDLAEVEAETLRALDTLPIAGGDEQRAAGRAHQPSAEMAAAARLRLLSP